MLRDLVLVGLLGAAAAVPQSGECSRKCDKTAAACVDECEAKFSGDPGPRVQCKVKCAEARQACDRGCK